MKTLSGDHDERLALPITEGVLLWSMRAWAVSSHQSIEPERRIATVLAGLGAPEAPEYLFGFMFAMLNGAVRPIGVSCPCECRVSRDEHALLEVFALAQEAQSFEAMLVLRGIVTPAAASAAYRSAEGVAAALLQSGRLLRPPARDATRLYALSSEYHQRGHHWPAPASVVVH